MLGGELRLVCGQKSWRQPSPPKGFKKPQLMFDVSTWTWYIDTTISSSFELIQWWLLWWKLSRMQLWLKTQAGIGSHSHYMRVMDTKLFWLWLICNGVKDVVPFKLWYQKDVQVLVQFFQGAFWILTTFWMHILSFFSRYSHSHMMASINLTGGSTYVHSRYCSVLFMSDI